MIVKPAIFIGNQHFNVKGTDVADPGVKAIGISVIRQGIGDDLAVDIIDNVRSALDF